MSAREEQLARITALKTIGQIRDYWDSEFNPFKASPYKGRNTPAFELSSSRYFDDQLHKWRLSGAKYFAATVPATLYDDQDVRVRDVTVEVGYFDQKGAPISELKYNAYIAEIEARAKEIEEAAPVFSMREAIQAGGLKPSKAGQEIKRLIERLRMIDDAVPDDGTAQNTDQPFVDPVVTPSFWAKIKNIGKAFKALFS